LGKQLRFFGDEKPAEVVGWPATPTTRPSCEPAPGADLTFSIWQYYFPTAVVYVRAAGRRGEPRSPRCTGACKSLDRNLWLGSAQRDQAIRESLWAAPFGRGCWPCRRVGLCCRSRHLCTWRTPSTSAGAKSGCAWRWAPPRRRAAHGARRGARLVAARTVLDGDGDCAAAAPRPRASCVDHQRSDALTFAGGPGRSLVVVGVGACWLREDHAWTRQGRCDE